MHHTIDYKDLEGQAKIDKAIKDIKFYLSEEKFEELSKVWQNDAETNGLIPFSRFRLGCEAFLGIEGYPVKAWAQHLNATSPNEIVVDIPE